MNKKIIIIIFLAVVCISIGIYKYNSNSVKEKKELDKEFITEYNDETKMFEVKEQNTGDVVYSSKFEENAEINLEFYKENPEYDAAPPMSPNASEIDDIGDQINF